MLNQTLTRTLTLTLIMAVSWRIDTQGVVVGVIGVGQESAKPSRGLYICCFNLSLSKPWPRPKPKPQPKPQP